MDFTQHTPTAQLTVAERTRAGYYGAIKAWATAQADIAQYYSVSADDTAFALTFTPLADNLTNFPAKITVDANAVKFDCIYSGTSAAASSFNHGNYAKDAVFYIYNDARNFMLTSDMSALVANISGKTFDGNTDARALIMAFTNNAYICTGGSAYTSSHSASNGNINRNCGGVSATYLLSRLAVPKTDMIADKVYTLDGGIDLPPAGVFTIAGKQFFRLFNNCVFKMED